MGAISGNVINCIRHDRKDKPNKGLLSGLVEMVKV